MTTDTPEHPFQKALAAGEAKWRKSVSVEDIEKLMDIQGRVAVEDLEHLEKITKARIAHSMEEAADLITRITAENAKLREALEPFASNFDADANVSPDDESCQVYCTVGDLRRAAKAMETK